jgi:predicted Ser/Thr protein kinase
MSEVTWIPRIGAEFAGYRLGSLLGHGGMSIVYRAEHMHLGRTVALKLLAPQLSEDEAFRERFERESRLAASLDHPNIIPIYEAGEEDGVLFIAMRYVEGADLKTRLNEGGPFDSDKVASLVAQVAAALEAAHVKGLIHRDVKPANVLIASGAGPEGADHVYLSDFGIAKHTAGAGLTRTGMFVGTADYASPEQIEGKPLDGRADVYALGCVVYEALTAERAYEKDSEVGMMYAHLLESAPSVTAKRPQLPPEIDDVVAKAMAKSRDDRYATPTELALAVKQALGAGTALRAAETVLASGPAASDSPPSPPTEESVSPPAAAGGGGRRRRVIAAALAGAAVLAAAVVIPILVFTGGNNTTASGTTPSTLLAVLVPTEIARDCTATAKPSSGVIEFDSCRAAEDAPASQPDAFDLTFYANAGRLERAYQAALKEADTGGNRITNCSATAGEKVWIHVATGKRGGRRICYLDKAGNFIVLWTHEKLGSDDHVDMLGNARQAGRAPTIFRSWWNSVNDFIGKCRPAISQELCLSTINRLSGSVPGGGLPGK